MEYRVAGVTFHPAAKAAVVGQRVRLVAEPDNPHDRRAVAIEALFTTKGQPTWHKVGHVPKEQAGPLTTEGSALPREGKITWAGGAVYHHALRIEVR